MPSGRWLWVGGTEWIEKPENFSGAYNCSSSDIVDWEAFALMMDLAMQGCGTGAVLEPRCIDQLPVIQRRLEVEITLPCGITPKDMRSDETYYALSGDTAVIRVGDSRQGWVSSYKALLDLASDTSIKGEVIKVKVDLSDVRSEGEDLKGFGGIANPIALPSLYGRCADVLNKAVGRNLTSVECCLLIDEAAKTIVAGNLRRSAGMRQGASDDQDFAVCKDNLWQEVDGNWVIDPERDALRMANHTRVYHHKPSEEECIEAVRKQYYSGEGAIQYAPEAIARANADLLFSKEKKSKFIETYVRSPKQAAKYLANLLLEDKDLNSDSDLAKTVANEIEYRMGIYGLNPCGM